MTTTTETSCPECKKKIKVAAELAGKKVRCKGCGHVFPIPAAAAAAKPAPAKAGADDEGDDPYALSKAAEESVARCPHCAQVLESAEAVICILCGYNLKTRQRVVTKKVHEATAGEKISWMLPGILSLAAVFGLIAFNLFYIFKLVAILEKSEDWSWITHKGVTLWIVLLSLVAMWFMGKFAFRRLIVEPTPPERVLG